MSTKISKQTVVRILSLNDMTNVKSSPMTPIISRTQTRSYNEGGSNATFNSGDHLVFNLQTGSDFIDVLQSFLVFDVKTTANVGWVYSALALFSDCQINQGDSPVDRAKYLNQYNFHRMQLMSENQKLINYRALMLCNDNQSNADVEEEEKDEVGYGKRKIRTGRIGAAAQRVMIPLKYLAGVFDSYKLMPPHLARGLRIDLTCENVARAMATIAGVNHPENYEITKAYILADTYKMEDTVLEYINSEYASKNTGLIYEYFSYNSAKSSTVGTNINIEFNQTSSQTVDALVCTPLTAEATNPAANSFRSAVMLDAARSQFAIGSHYMPNHPTSSIVEHYAQYMYYGNRLRENKEMGTSFRTFIGTATAIAAGNWQYGTGVYAQTFQRSNIMEISGMALSKNSSLSFEATGVTPACDTYIFVRHLRRAVLFLQSMTVEK